MKIAVPLREQRFTPHFGGAETFALYTVDAGNHEVLQQQLITPPEHGRGIFPTWLRSQGASVVLAGGMGPRANEILARNGIEVLLGVSGDDPDTMVQQYLAGTLKSGGELCHEHGFHDCGHHDPPQGTHGDHHAH